MAERILESDLQLPALYLVKQRNGRLTTTQLSKLLREILKPSGEDLELLSTRGDDKFSQIVRNLTAKERNFVKNGYIEREAKANSPLFITPKGEEYLNRNREFVEYLVMNDFAFKDIIEPLKSVSVGRKKVEVFDENVIISEGGKKIVKGTVYERSSKLRDYALKYFSEQGNLNCKCCNFNFEDFYGADLGKGFIEIHHTKPIFKYANDDMERTLHEALQNLIPVCSNCHRMIHRNWSKPYEIQALIITIQRHGVFERNTQQAPN